MQERLAKQTIVLLGVGHTNAHVLKMWRMQPIPDTQLICVSNHPIATYSGMMPGVLAGNYRPEQMEIDLVRLCAANKARLILDEVTGLDAKSQHLLFAERPPLPYDALSIGIGSVPSMDSVAVADGAEPLAIKPMQTFLARLHERLGELSERITNRPLQIAIVGGGAGGVEIAFCLPHRIRRDFPDTAFQIHVIHGGQQLLPGHRDATAQQATDRMREAGATLHFNRRVTRLEKESVTLDDPERGDTLPIDLVLWATSAIAPPLLTRLQLRRDEQDFLLTNDKLQSVSHERIFAVGDTGTMENVDRPKSGVFAVRQGPILWQNLSRSLRGRPLLSFVPQRDFLKLLNTGNGRAIGEHKGRTFEGRLAWWWKDYIDKKFMRMYQDYEPPKMTAASLNTPDQDAEAAMRCLGCGGKVGGGVLRRALAKLDIPQRDEVKLGLDDPDDAAVLQFAGDPSLLVTTDFFAAPLDDPYTVGRLSALNALSDVWAMGGSPTAALTIATVPFGGEKQQANFLAESLAGSLYEFRKANTALVGGHTIEGPRFTLGFTIVGQAAERSDDSTWTKSSLEPGDQLVLSKPLGSGVLLAAAMRANCRGEWYVDLLNHLTKSNQASAEIAGRHGLRAVTDVTGFGLAGHLLEMLVASDVNARIELQSLPLLAGTESLVEQGIVSTLDTANRAAEERIEADEKTRKSPRYTILFDPQTSGGLLLGVPASKCDVLLAEMDDATVIGTVTSRAAGAPTIVALLSELVR